MTISERGTAVTLGLAVLLQGICLVLMDRPAPGVTLQIVLVSAATGLAVSQTWSVRMRINHRVDMLLVMAAFGGLGMVVGTWIDSAAAQGGTAAGSCHPGHESAGSPWNMIPTWMTGVMLVTAIPAGFWLTRCAQLARTGWRRWLSTHVLGNLAMVVGMVWMGHWLGAALGHAVGSTLVGHHLAMVLGMLLGMEVGMFAGEAALGLRPWQEWRWRESWDDVVAGSRSLPPRPRTRG
jgi:hypothetical protein